MRTGLDDASWFNRLFLCQLVYEASSRESDHIGKVADAANHKYQKHDFSSSSSIIINIIITSIIGPAGCRACVHLYRIKLYPHPHHVKSAPIACVGINSGGMCSFFFWHQAAAAVSLEKEEAAIGRKQAPNKHRLLRIKPLLSYCIFMLPKSLNETKMDRWSSVRVPAARVASPSAVPRTLPRCAFQPVFPERFQPISSVRSKLNLAAPSPPPQLLPPLPADLRESPKSTKSANLGPAPPGPSPFPVPAPWRLRWRRAVGTPRCSTPPF